MKTTTINTLYWVFTPLFAILMLLDGISGIVQVEAGKAPMQLLGYPLYLMVILGAFKALGALALMQTRYVLLKEWAYAGFAFNFIGAAASWAAIGQAFGVVPPFVMLAILFFTYFLWKRKHQLSIAQV